MNQSSLERWIPAVLDTRDEEISCSQCFDQAPAFVEAELDGQHQSEVYALFRQHLGQCRVCREEYEALREILREEARGGGLG